MPLTPFESKIMKKFLGLTTLVSLVFSVLVVTSAPASADVANDDSTLASMGVSRGWIQMNGGFSPSRTEYDVFTPESSIVFDFTAANSNAAIVVTEPNGTTHDYVGSGQAVIDYEAKTSQLTTIKVTSADSTKSTTYKYNVSSKAIPKPELVSFGQTTLPSDGGVLISAVLKHAYMGDSNCYTNVSVGYKDPNGVDESDNFGRWDSKYQDDGTTLVTLRSTPTYYNFRYTGKADLILGTSCSVVESLTSNWAYPSSRAVYKDYLTMANPTVTSNTIPDQISFASVFDVKGFGITSNSDLSVYMVDPADGSKVWTWGSWSMTNTWARFRLGGDWDSSKWSKTKPVDVVVEQYDDETGKPAVELLRKHLTFVPYTPKNVSLSPAKGPIVGGNVVKIQGYALCNYFREDISRVYIGGVESPTSNWSCAWGQSSDGYNWDGIDRATVTIPAGTKAGQVSIEVDNGFGRVALPYKYTYGAKPTVTSVSPSTVANTGASIITINGTDFGIAGTPTVTIDGIKSPWVQRVSASKLLAMVPADAGKTGVVDLNVISSSGGGALDTPSSITLADSSANPTVTSVTPSAAGLAGGDTITIKGTGFVAGATGVYIGDYPAAIITSTATEITVELPSGDAAGAVNVVVGTPTGLVTKANAFTYAATPGITSVSPAVIPSSSVVANTKVTITGVGFGSTGTIKVGSAAAVAYTATAGGTTISNIAIPTTAAGIITLLVTPTGAKTPFNASVTVSAPKITYFGPNPKWDAIGSTILGSGYAQASAGTAGGEKFLIEGTGFGTSGKVKIGTTVVTATSYTDTSITFVMPAKQAGNYDISVVPTLGGAIASIADGIGIAGTTAGVTITQVASATPNLRSQPDITFDPGVDASDLFVITGTKLNGTDATKTRVYVGNSDAIVPVSVTATSITFHAPRSFSPVNWETVRVTTNIDETYQQLGILYVGAVPPPTVMSPGFGLCLKTATAGRNPAQLVATGDGVFGASGTVSIDGTNFPANAVNWSANEVDVNFAGLTTDLANPWGGKTVVFTPNDSSKVSQSFGFNCAVNADVTTKLSGNSSSLTIQAGTAYTASATMDNPLPGTTFVPAADGYSYQSAADHSAWAWNQNVKSGLPVAAGDYYVKVNTGAATYDRTKYNLLRTSNEVHLVISGTPITFTPKLVSGGATKQYKGQLGDGTSGSSNDIGYTATAVADDVTAVTWQYRNHTCALADANYSWSSGLPRDVAIAPSGCGGDDTTVSSWDIRVASFQMLSGGVDKSIYYLPTFNTFNLTITKKSVTATAVKSEKVYDGTNAATLGEITVNGAIDGDNVTLDPSSSQGATFADATVGNSKPVTLVSPLALSSYWRNNYTLTNPNLTVTGKITKADARVKLTPSTSSVIMSNPQNVAITIDNTDSRNGITPDNAAGVAAVVVVSKTPTVCSYNAGSVTPIKPGDCIIQATQAASTNYNAALSWHDDSTTVESITIKIYPAPKTLSVVADDITIATGEALNPSAVVTGLLDGDNLDGFTFDYFQGSTHLDSAPTAVGTYKIVPSGGNLAALDSTAYSNVYKYVSAKLVITPAPPTISALSPNHGPEAGGNVVKITGEGLSQVTSVKIGEITFRKPYFTVNGSGTEITFKAPRGVGVVDLVLRAGNASVTGQYTYDAPPVVTTPLSLKLNLNLVAGNKLSGQQTKVVASGMKGSSEFTLYLGDKLLFKGTTGADGSINQNITIPAKACGGSGKQDLIVNGTAPDGSAAKDTAFVVTDDTCNVAASAVKGDKTWTLSGFLFNYNDYSLTAGGIKSLSQLVSLIKGAKTVTIYGYTETDTKSPAVKKANLILAANRCVTVMDYLKAKGIKAIYKTYGKGGVNPVSLTDQSKNRRVVITATY